MGENKIQREISKKFWDIFRNKQTTGGKVGTDEERYGIRKNPKKR